MVLLRGSGVVVLDLLFPQLLASNSIVSLRFGRFGFGLGKNRREKAPNRENPVAKPVNRPPDRTVRRRTRPTGRKPDSRPRDRSDRPPDRTRRRQLRSNRTTDRLLRPRHPAISTTTTTTTTTTIAGITCRSPCNPSSFCDLSHRALLV